MQIRLFCFYSCKDEFLRQELETQLSTLDRQSLVTELLVIGCDGAIAKVTGS
ncbi:MAG: hypothetical protein KME11_03590 [Timaviella obliquedivisa GSE-PSE-MK23-08B]|jgi:hypothetical protein|nr:hypothetical protein [Timaviella obliquedivisa GSE-PSE-MK23-08B]